MGRPGVPFPKNFQTTVKLIFKRLFRVYAHMYYSHFQKVVSLNEEAHLNTSFKVRPAGCTAAGEGTGPAHERPGARGPLLA